MTIGSDKIRDRRKTPQFSALLSLRTDFVMPDPSSSRVYFEGSSPILRVEDMKAALAFYVDKLGFQKLRPSVFSSVALGVNLLLLVFFLRLPPEA